MRGGERAAGQLGLRARERRAAGAEAEAAAVIGRMLVTRPRGRLSAGAMAATPSTARAPVVLGIETSCDETAAALVDGERRVLAEALRSQEDRARAVSAASCRRSRRAPMSRSSTG